MGDRTKTAEELAAEEEQRLQRLEAQRLKRLRGPSGDDLGEEGSASEEEDDLGGFAARRAKRRKREAAGAQTFSFFHKTSCLPLRLAQTVLWTCKYQAQLISTIMLCFNWTQPSWSSQRKTRQQRQVSQDMLLSEQWAMFGLLHLTCHAFADDLIVSHDSGCCCLTLRTESQQCGAMQRWFRSGQQ